MAIEILNHRQFPLHFNSKQKLYLLLNKRKGMQFAFEKALDNSLTIKPLETAKLYFSFSFKNISEGDYEFILGIADGITDPSVNSIKYRLHL